MSFVNSIKSNRNYAGPVLTKGRPTNNIAEIEAAIHAINLAAEKGIERLTIRTDSRFLVTAYYHYFKFWVPNGWTKANGDPVKNTPQFKALLTAVRCHSEYMRVQFKHIRGHSGDQFNEEADRLAKIGVKKYRMEYGMI